MADDAKADDHLDQLRDQFALQIRTAVRDLPPHLALQLADSLCAVQLNLLAGLRVTYKAAPKIDGEAIAEDWARGLSIGEITRKHGVTRPTAYKYHPNKGRLPRHAG
jgi:hypothetical protein